MYVHEHHTKGMEELNAQIGHRLREARVAAGLTQQEAADEFMVQRQTISAWENAHSQPTTNQLMLLGLTYAVSIDYVLYGIRMVPADQGSVVDRVFRPIQQKMKFEDSDVNG